MTSSRYLYSCFICLFIAACDTQEPATPVTKTPEITKEPAATLVTKPPEIKKEAAEIKPPLDLSLDNISIEYLNDKDKELVENETIGKNSTLFKALNQQAAESEFSVKGKLLMNDNDDYLESVDGAQIEFRFKTD